MREVVFRGKRIDNGEWLVSRTLLQNSDDERFCWMPVYGDKFGTVEDDKGNILRMEYGTLYRVDPATVGQYTGLKDKNGKRIFEGDIVEYNDGYDYFKGKVVFELGAFGIGNSEVCQAFIGNCDNFASLWDIYWEQEPIDAPELYYCTIVGNIHDNPELMEVR